MMKKMCALLMVLLIAGGAVFAGGGGESAQSAAAPDTIKIGASLALTGSLSRFGVMMKNGYEMWKDEVNAKGGINVGGTKKPVEIIYYDDQSDNNTSAQLTEKLITQDNVQFLLGPYGSGPTFATTAIAERYNIITMATTANAANIYTRGFKNVFAVLPPGVKIFDSFIDMLAAQNPRPAKLAIIAPNDNFPVSVAEGADKYAKSKGFEVVYYEVYPKGVKDMSSTILKIKNSGAEVLLGSGYLEESVLTVRQLNEQRVSLKAIGFTTGPELQDFRDNLGSDAENICGVAWWMPQMTYTDPLFVSAQEYTKKYTDKYGPGLAYQGAAGSQGGYLLQMAIEKAGSTDTDKVREVLAAYDGTTFWGPVKFDATGQNIAGGAVTFQIQKALIQTVWPEGAASAKPVYPLK
ncbi:MAG: amino acid ABC transporter substrate-binding protein [Spirochaetales bacterium]|jgi:branched-chain amino acid transport system substrate-binding protein|nr:amino acid ABC transporter substrate-binding protein [Spirochaetales bacterium]